MIKPFAIEDLGNFMPNQFSDPDVVLDQLTDKERVVETMWGENDSVQAVMCYQNYWGRCWSGFFLIAENLEKRTPVRLKSHIRLTMEKHKAVRLHTDSQANDCLKAWHEWLGFTWEGCRKKLIFGKDYDMWALVREGE